MKTVLPCAYSVLAVSSEQFILNMYPIRLEGHRSIRSFFFSDES